MAIRSFLLIVSIFGSIQLSAAEQSIADKQNLLQTWPQRMNQDLILYFEQKPLNEQSFPRVLNRSGKIELLRQQLINESSSTQARVLALLKKFGIHFQSLYINNSVVIYDVNYELAEELAALSEIVKIRKDVRVPLSEAPVYELRPQDVANFASHLSTIKVDKVSNELGILGKNIVIGGQDTGYFVEHNALKNSYRGQTANGFDHNYNWHDGIRETRSQTPIDDHGHGTHTMGTIVGFDGGKNRIGVAPEAKWIGCRNMHKGFGSISSYLECLQFFLAPYPFGADPRTSGDASKAPHIVNNSWACSKKEGCVGDELIGAVEALRLAGIFSATAAGNEGPNCNTVAEPPAHYSNFNFTVGAYNRYMKDIAFFSSRGPSAFDGGLAPQIVAPGEIIRSSVNGGVNKYDDKGGTSMASPQVAGVVALMWSANPSLIGDIAKTEEILRSTAQPLTSTQNCGGFSGTNIPNAVFGYGMLDAFAAVKKAQALPAN